jgi:hypothetical protein
MINRQIASRLSVTLLILRFGSAICTSRPVNDTPVQTDAARAAEDAIRAVVAESAKDYESNDCKGMGIAS